MILVLDRLKAKTNFSDTESKVADYILDNVQDVITMTIHELASETFSSASTITRLCKKISIEGFGEFKVQLAKEISVSNLSTFRIEDDLPFSPNDSPQDIAQNILNLNIQSAMDTYNHIDLNQIMRIAKKMMQASSIMFFGEGQSLILCEDFQYKLLRIGIDTKIANQIGFQLMQSYSLSKKDIVIMISYYGKNPSNLEVAKVLKSKGIPIVLITGPYKSSLIPLADEVIQVPPQEEIFLKMASYSSRSAIQLVIDILFATIFSLDYEANQKKLEVNI